MSGEGWLWIAAAAAIVAVSLALLIYNRWSRDESASQPSSTTIAYGDLGWLRGLFKLRDQRRRSKAEVDALQTIAREKNFGFHSMMEKDLAPVEREKSGK